MSFAMASNSVHDFTPSHHQRPVPYMVPCRETAFGALALNSKLPSSQYWMPVDTFIFVSHGCLYMHTKWRITWVRDVCGRRHAGLRIVLLGSV